MTALQATHRQAAWVVTSGRMLLYIAALVLYLAPLASQAGLLGASVATVIAVLIAERVARTRIRPLAVVLCGILIGVLAIVLGTGIRGLPWPAATIGLQPTFLVAEVVTFSLLAFSAVLVLRFFSTRTHLASLAEVVLIAGSVATFMADHRHRMLHRPRFFADWAWSMGLDPTAVLVAIGLSATLVASLLLLRYAPLVKVLITLILLLILGALFYSASERRISTGHADDPLGLSGPRAGGENDDSDNPFKDDYRSAQPPKPVAIAILRDDYTAADGVIYFRQRAVSEYNGHRLVASRTWDEDLLDTLPSAGEVLAPATQNPLHHLVVPTTMILMVDHPQPPALSHATRLLPVENPSPAQFVSAYDATSLVSTVPAERLLGRQSIPPDWDDARRQHYTMLPDDPRYQTLADTILQTLDPRFFADDMAKALAIKRYLEREGFYTLRSRHSDTRDPTASFLFGSLRGYCVHFAHAATYLLRSQGIAARVALGYAVQTTKHSGGSAILIMGDRAHAWPEIFLDGVGWVTLDIYPERTDMPPPPPVDYDLERLLGEMARRDTQLGFAPEGKPLVIPWMALGKGLLASLALLLCLAYAVKIGRRLAPRLRRHDAAAQAAYRAVLDRLSDLGYPRRYGETREDHARRIAPVTPAFLSLTEAHLARALGSAANPSFAEMRELICLVGCELRRNVPRWRRLMAWMHPWGWLLTR